MEELSTDAIEDVLQEVGYGFLGLAVDDQPYVIPMSFGYADALYFQMNAQGRKQAFLDPGTPACLTVLRYDPDVDRSSSVIVEGELQRVPEDEMGAALDALAANALFGTDLSLWGVPIQDAAQRLFVLEPTSISGRRFGEGAAR